MAFPCASVSTNQLSSFQGKVVFGDYTKDSNQLFSSWVISDLSGGHGVVDIHEGTDTNRYRFGTLYTRYPNQITAPRAVAVHAGDDVSQFVPLGDYVESGVIRMFAAQGTDLLRWGEGVGFSSSLGTLTAAPVGKGIAFQGTGTYRLFMPMGSDGYARWNGSALTNVASSGSQPAALAFLVWDDKLVALDILGQLWYSTDGTTFSTYGVTAKLDESYEPRNIVVGYDRADNPCIHVITDRDVWAFDPAGPKLFRTELFFPPTPNAGLGSAMWRGALYVSSSMGTMQYTGASISAMGLDRDDGLPLAYRGHIMDFEPEYNGLYALVQGEDNIKYPFMSLQVYTGFGWHTEWHEDGAEAGTRIATLGWCRVSNAQGVYRLWWGVNAQLYSMQLPTDYANPRAQIADETGDFAIDLDEVPYYLETGRFDASMKGYTKIASHVSLFLSGDMTDSSIQLYFRVDDVLGWTAIGNPITTTGRHIIEFGSLTSDGVSTGYPFGDIELRIELLRELTAPATVSPIIEDLTLAFTKVVTSSFNWTVQVDLSKTHKGNSPERMSAKLDQLIASTYFFGMRHLNETYRVRVAQYSGTDSTGEDRRRVRTISILELPSGL